MIWEPIQDIHLRWHLFINLTTGCHCQFREGATGKKGDGQPRWGERRGSHQAKGSTEIKEKGLDKIEFISSKCSCVYVCVCVCVCVCKKVCSLGYYHNPIYVFTPVYMTSNEFFIAVCVYVDIKMLLYSKVYQYEGEQASDVMGNVLYFRLYLVPEEHLLFKRALSIEARFTTKYSKTDTNYKANLTPPNLLLPEI